MSNSILYDIEARKKIKMGVDKVANAVKTTLGPRGRNVIFRRGEKIIVTNDGVTVAKQINLKDEYENLGASLVKEVASKTNDIAGDGTTTSTVLLQEILNKGISRIETGIDATLVRKGLLKGAEIAIKKIKEISQEIKTKEEMKYVANISAQDLEIGEVISDAMEKVGKDGVITIEESNGYKIESEIVNGMKLNRGYVSPFMADQNTQKIDIQKPVILVTDKKFTSAKELLPILEQLSVSGRKNIVIFAQEFSGDALATIVINKMKGILNIAGVSVPVIGEYGSEVLEDIAILTGGILISEISGIKFEDLKGDSLNQVIGEAERIKITRDDTIVIGGQGQKLEDRINSLSELIKQEDDDFKIKKLKDRIAKLKGGVGIIKVGGLTQTEIKEKLYKVEDALNATKAAVEEGIIVGGGVALIKAKEEIDLYLKQDRNESEEEIIGLKIMSEALESPLRQILKNAGINDISSIIEKLRKTSKEKGFDFKGLDKNSEIVIIDAIKKGIVDPVKVTISALENATSIAGSILTSEVAIIEDKEEEKRIK